MCNTLCTLVIIILPHPLVRHTPRPLFEQQGFTIQLSMRMRRQKKQCSAFAEELTIDLSQRTDIHGFHSVLFPSRKFLFSLESQYYYFTIHMKKYIALVPKNNLNPNACFWLHNFVHELHFTYTQNLFWHPQGLFCYNTCKLNCS